MIISYETLNEHGSLVGYQFRFESTATRATRILFLTEGLLLRLIASDPLLLRFDVIVLDEVHERHVSCDVIMAVLRGILVQRPKLRALPC